jgi:hypothetical protein
MSTVLPLVEPLRYDGSGGSNTRPLLLKPQNSIVVASLRWTKRYSSFV